MLRATWLPEGGLEILYLPEIFLPPLSESSISNESSAASAGIRLVLAGLEG